jgi:hypothetical protein
MLRHLIICWAELISEYRHEEFEFSTIGFVLVSIKTVA